MEFRTVVPPLKHQGLITHASTVVMLGSCFTDNIGKRLNGDMFDAVINPTGTLYNPLSVANAIDRLISGKPYKESDLFSHLGLWRSFDHHSSFASAGKEKTLEAINDSLQSGVEALARASVLVVTWGSAIAYRHLSTGKIVANCHKLPAHDFEVEQLSVGEIAERWALTLKRLLSINPDIKIIYTVSPIRHRSYGMAGNTHSKAKLIEAAHLFADGSNSIYFPSYEIMMDDLRDYRFYAADMIHPSETACDYIYDVFSRSFFDNATLDLAALSRRLTLRTRHRVFSDDTSTTESFRRATIDMLNNHLKAHPEMERAITRCITTYNDLQSLTNS